jgi:hypothetical protein
MEFFFSLAIIKLFYKKVETGYHQKRGGSEKPYE